MTMTEVTGGETLSTLVDLIGVEKTKLLLARRGGEEVYIPGPDRLPPDHWLAVTVGYDAAMRVAEAWRGERISLPLGPEAGSRNAQHRAVREAVASGAGVNQIVRATGLHARTVRRIKNRRTGRVGFSTQRVDPRQQRLFGDLLEQHDKEI